MHRNHHPSSKCTDILPLTHECTENRHFSGKCTNILCIDILTLIHENTAILIPQVNAKDPSHMNAPKSSSLRCTGILPLTHECTSNRHSYGKCTGILLLTHECTEIIIPQVNAPESYPSHMNAPQIVTPQVNARTSYPSHMNAPKSSSLK